MDIVESSGSSSLTQQLQQLSLGKNELNIKATKGNEHRRLQLVKENGAATFSFSQLLDKMKLVFGNDELLLSYIDDEGDLVTFSSDNELDVATSLLKEGEAMRLFVGTKTSPPQRPSAKGQWKQKQKESKREEKKLKKAMKNAERQAKKAKKKEQKAKRNRETPDEEPSPKKEKINKEERAFQKTAAQELEEMAGDDKMEDVQILLVDGNSLLFITKLLRNLILENKRNHAERILTIICKNFHESFVDTLQQTEVIYSGSTVAGETFNTFKTVDAQTQGFKSSEDAIVSKLTALKELTKNVMLVSTDGELIKQFKEQGAKILWPTRWLQIAFQRVNKNPAIKNVEDWFVHISTNI